MFVKDDSFDLGDSSRIIAREFLIGGDWDNIEIVEDENVPPKKIIKARIRSNGSEITKTFNDGRVTQFDEYEKNEQKRYRISNQVLIKPKEFSMEQSLPWKNDNYRDLKNAWHLSTASYLPKKSCLDKPDAYIRQHCPQLTFLKVISLDGIKQKCVLAKCEATNTLCFALRGSVDFDDWFVNLNIDLIHPSDIDNAELGVHKGFHERAMRWKAKLLQELNSFKDFNRVITTGKVNI